jgi:hypothetical protein
VRLLYAVRLLYEPEASRQNASRMEFKNQKTGD